MFPEQKPFQSTAAPNRGTLLGIVLDLSGSMYGSISNDAGGQLSRIEGLSKAFSHVMEDVELFLKEHPGEEHPSLRLFVHGFGFQVQSNLTWEKSIGDVFAILANLEEQTKRYRPLQREIENTWSEEFAQVIEEERVIGDAKQALREFVERELKEQAIYAQQQRSGAKFQRWCESSCQQLAVFDNRLKARIAQYQGWVRILLPFALGLLWLLRGPTLALSSINGKFEAWLQRKLIALRQNAHIYATQQAEKVVIVTKKSAGRTS